MKRLLATIGTTGRLALPYFRGEDRWLGRALLAAVIGMELGIVALNVMFNQWISRFFNAMQSYQWDTFVSESLLFCTLATIYIAVAVYQLYLNQRLQIRWRRWMTIQYLGDWLNIANHSRMQLVGDTADNSDQRIADDITLFVERTVNLSIPFLGAIVTLAFFFGLLWVMSEEAPLLLFGGELTIPGYLVWAAAIYAALLISGFTTRYAQVWGVFPFLVVSPAYFVHKMPIGTMIQIASAFASVQGALWVIVTHYRSIAELRAVTERGFSGAIEAGRTGLKRKSAS